MIHNWKNCKAYPTLGESKFYILQCLCPSNKFNVFDRTTYIPNFCVIEASLFLNKPYVWIEQALSSIIALLLSFLVFKAEIHSQSGLEPRTSNNPTIRFTIELGLSVVSMGQFRVGYNKIHFQIHYKLVGSPLGDPNSLINLACNRGSKCTPCQIQIWILEPNFKYTNKISGLIRNGSSDYRAPLPPQASVV